LRAIAVFKERDFPGMVAFSISPKCNGGMHDHERLGQSRLPTLLLIFFAVAWLAILLATASPLQADEMEDRISWLLADMSREEKIGQTALRGMSSRQRGELTDELKAAVRAGRIGAFLNVMDKEHVEELQRIAVEESPHGIPLIFGRDVIHGFRTIFPIPLGIAATWDPALAEQSSAIAAAEATTYGIRWTFAPMVDIARDPRWGRIAESPGEDPYLASALAAAYVRGFQGADLSASDRMAACAKHFAAYGAAEGGRDYNTANVPEGLLRDVYLRPFHAAQQAGVATFMTAFNELNGVPCTGYPFLLREVLRDQWGFDGFVVSDWTSVTEMIAHGFCTDEAHAAERAAEAGLDVEMVSTAYEQHLAKMIDDGKFSDEALNSLVRNILRVKMRLGLFERPGFDRDRDNIVLSEPHRAAAQTAAQQSLVLLKNKNQLLPLSREVGRVAVVGPLADAPHEQLGTWAFDGQQADTQTPLPSIRKLLGDQRVIYANGLAYSRDGSRDGFGEAVSAARSADVVLCFVGEEAILSGEAHSRADINLPGAQEALVHELRKTGKPIVLVILAGRPITLGNILDEVDAVLMAWHPGTMGGPAIADVLFGAAEPGGRLPVTWPKAVGQIPIYYNHTNTGRPPGSESFVPIDKIPIGAWQSSLGNTSHYLDLGYEPQFPFGFGLTYTTFEYANLRVSPEGLTRGQSIEVSADVTNTGSRKGSDVVQLYVRDQVGDVTRPVRELKGFQRVELSPGETRRVRFQLSPDDLAFTNQQMELVTEPGRFDVWIGANSGADLHATFDFE
jgi:beta-glucosidase